MTSDPTPPLDWVMVPREPTKEMIAVAVESLHLPWREIQRMLEAYRAMLAAAPTPQAPDAGLRRALERISLLERTLEPFAKFRLEGFDGEVLEVVPSSPQNPARRIEPIWASHFRRAREALSAVPTVDVGGKSSTGSNGPSVWVLSAQQARASVPEGDQEISSSGGRLPSSPLEREMLAALEKCREALDGLIGDTDPHAETPALLACQAASKVITKAVKP